MRAVTLVGRTRGRSVGSMRRSIASLATIVSVSAVAAGTAAAGTAKGTFDVHVGDGFGGVVHGPDVARAPNGDTVSVVGSGTFDSAAKTASGSATFQHRDAKGNLVASGSLTITGLTTFVFYGCGVAGGEPIPPALCGGRAIYPVHIVGHPASNPSATAEFDGTLEVTCAVGDKVPHGAHEGIHLDIPGQIHFNKSVSGENIFVRT